MNKKNKLTKIERSNFLWEFLFIFIVIGFLIVAIQRDNLREDTQQEIIEKIENDILSHPKGWSI